MSWIKRAYIGGDKYKCTRYDGIVHPAGKNFECSKIVLVDNDGSHLPPVKTLADQMAHNCGIDLKVSYIIDHRAGLQDYDAVLTSYCPRSVIMSSRCHRCDG